MSSMAIRHHLNSELEAEACLTASSSASADSLVYNLEWWQLSLASLHGEYLAYCKQSVLFVADLQVASRLKVSEFKSVNFKTQDNSVNLFYANLYDKKKSWIYLACYRNFHCHSDVADIWSISLCIFPLLTCCQLPGSLFKAFFVRCDMSWRVLKNLFKYSVVTIERQDWNINAYRLAPCTYANALTIFLVVLNSSVVEAIIIYMRAYSSVLSNTVTCIRNFLYDFTKLLRVLRFLRKTLSLITWLKLFTLCLCVCNSK